MTLLRLNVSSLFEIRNKKITSRKGEHVAKSPVSPNNLCKKNMKWKRSGFMLTLLHRHRFHCKSSYQLK